jgi:hypothetical protein
MQLGELTVYLMGAQKGWPIHGPDHVLDNVSALINLVNELRLPQSQASLDELRVLMNQMGSEWSKKMLGESEARLLVSTVGRLRETMHAESDQQLACILADDQFGAQRLLGDVRYLMTPRVYDLLPDAVRNDFTGAGRCIAFEMPDAAAFHLSRAMGELVAFYQSELSGGAGRVNDRRWGLETDDLLECLDGAPGDIVQSVGSLVRELGRPERTPGASFTIERVRDLFSVAAESAIQVMGDIARRHTTSGASSISDEASTRAA